jgi:hypothetical protein
VIGYDKASAIAHKADDDGTTLREAASPPPTSTASSTRRQWLAIPGATSRSRRRDDRKVGAESGWHVSLFRNMSGALETIRKWFRRTNEEAEGEAKGAEPVATPSPGGLGVDERETSTNAQTEGASGQPWPGND